MSENNAKPTVTSMTVKVRRVVNTGAYESYELTEEVEAQPDPEFTAKQNLTRLQALVSQHVNEACNNLVAQLQLAGTTKED